MDVILWVVKYQAGTILWCRVEEVSADDEARRPGMTTYQPSYTIAVVIDAILDTRMMQVPTGLEAL